MPSFNHPRKETLWDREKMLVSSILSFSHNVFYPIKEKLHYWSHSEIVFSKYGISNLDILKGLNFVTWSKVNPFPNKPFCLPICSTSHLKTLWEKEKLLKRSKFSFSHVFYPFGKLFAIIFKAKIVICKIFEFGSV